MVVTLNWEATYDPSCVTGPVTANPPEMPNTGAAPTPLGFIAVGLIALGAGLLGTSRRRATA